MYQHLRLDHRPPREAPAELVEPTELAPAEPAPEPPATEDVLERNRFVVRMIATAAVLTFVAALSWQLAALLSVVLVAMAAVRSSIQSRIERRQEDQ
jgi:hypothetical protein